ncbi:MAG TPA: lipase maturation factor family protein [Candidatus Limnocylindrales bacterium]|nr:lipase maturation factor family protein [Candidatus Limnocylindrales bacterium]
MPDLTASDHQLARFVLERGIAAIYLVAFVVALDQFPALLGEHGLMPARRFVAARRFLEAPSLFHLGYSDRRLIAVASAGALIAALLVLGVLERAPLPVTMLAWFVLWVLYQSIVNVGQTFYAFGWETLLLEAGFLAIFLGNDEIAPPWLTLVLFRWLAFRVEFGAGLIKLRGDRCWRELTCMEWHHETQPLPNPLSWFFHHLPRRLHRVEVVGNFVAQLVLPFGLFLPQPFASMAAVLMIGTQLYLVVSGNYAWLNWLTILAASAAIGDVVVPRPLLDALGLAAPGAASATTPGWFTAAVIGVTGLVAVLSWFPVRNMASPEQAMNASFDPFHLVNTYGAFGTVGRRRDEVVVEGTAGDPEDEAGWREYRFRAKPGDPRRLSPQIAPYHLRLDWLMWFIPLSPYYAQGWFGPFLERLLAGDRATLRLLGRNPFPDRPPTWIRARLFRYRYTTIGEWRETRAWWVRTLVGELVQPVRLPPGGGR